MTLLDDNFKESEHPRGQPGNSGQFASSGGGGGGKEQPNFRGSLARESDKPSAQPVKSLEELYERAKKEEPAFKKTISSLAEKYGAEAKFTPPEYAEPGTILKSRSAAERKLSSELGGDPTKMRDVLRATIVGSTVEFARKAATDFIAEHGENILRVKDRYADPIEGGYRDILINYRTPDGLVAEVQFNSKNMVKAKNEEAHALYEKARALKPPPDVIVLRVLEQQMTKIYEAAYMADGGDNWRALVPARDAQSGVLRRYRLEQPGVAKFEAAIVERDGKLYVKTNRGEGWADDDTLNFVDLVMPEQNMADWEVTPVEPRPLDAHEDELGARATDRRMVDRNVDFEYYTSESLGPRRERTPEGFLICYDVPVARVGEMVYGPGEVPPELGVGRDGRIRVTRADSEVFRPKSMASLNGKPVTDDHPPVDVDPKNWKYYTRGVVVNPHRGEDDLADFLVADLIIWDAETIADIDAGKREVSCGYNPDYLQILDNQQEPIQGRGEQINIKYNHLALVTAGRCGPACAIGDRKTIDSASSEADASFYSPYRADRLARLADRL